MAVFFSVLELNALKIESMNVSLLLLGTCLLVSLFMALWPRPQVVEVKIEAISKGPVKRRR